MTLISMDDVTTNINDVIKNDDVINCINGDVIILYFVLLITSLLLILYVFIT